MSNVRKTKMISNVIIGSGSQIFMLLIQFISRRLFLQYLSADYLGINGLYSNILSVLSLAELGLGTAVVFSLYKPVAENDYDRINALMAFVRKVYWIIAACVLGVGIILVPFLPFLVTSDIGLRDITCYYLLFLINSTVSYIAADKFALLNANQIIGVQKIISTAINVLQHILQLVILCVWKNYYLYLGVQLIMSLVYCTVISVYTKRRFPYLKRAAILDKSSKKEIFTNVWSTSVYKVGLIAVNNTDNILISSIVSTAVVGLYSNYCVIITAIQNFVINLSIPLLHSIGNLNAEESGEKMHSVFRLTIFVYHYIAAFVSISLFFIFNDFIPIWLGGEYTFNNQIVFIIAFNYYLTYAINPVTIYREAVGLFKKVKFLMLYRALINIVLSIVLGYLFGIFGILLATTISCVCTDFWYEPMILYRDIFGRKVSSYWVCQGKYALCTVVAVVISFIINSFLDHSFIFVFVKGVIFFAVTTTVFFAVNMNCFEVKWFKKQLVEIRKNLIQKIRRKKHEHF